MTDDFPQLRRLAYEDLDQDWDLIHRDPVDFVRDFVQYEHPDATRALTTELGSVLVDGRTEEQLAAWWLYDLRSEFEPHTVGLTYRQWFRHVADVLRAAAPDAPFSP